MADLVVRAPLWVRPAVVRLHDPDEVLRLLRADRIGAAYPLGDVDPRGQPRGEWFLAGDTLVGLQRLGHGVSLWASGTAAGLSAVLRRLDLPAELYFSGPAALIAALRPRYRITACEEMIRMAVTAGRFRPAGSATRLSPADLDQINRLYRLGAGGYISRQHVADGVYYGIFDGGRLVAVAGTHFINPTERLGAVGNVFTHPAYRGRGFATQVTSAVILAILDRCRDIVLNVSAANAPAQAVYRKLGFREAMRFVEAVAVRRPGGIAGWLQRAVERLRR
ncbi:MAG: GNAT family N-acetyltransferase [Chloroflexota bacterium]|nr:GNAT family N-acetyltransferase [Dehalococcoidia bacterium]MDW8252581.1 GNAT family N-acetyltransferase [Chloroflexota bacterium]